MNDISAIETAIVGVLKTVDELNSVYDYEPIEVSGLPGATVFYAGFDSDDKAMPGALETHENWVLRLYVKLDDAEIAQSEMKTLVPKVREAFRANRSLDNTCLYCTMTRGRVYAVTDKNTAQLMCEIALTAVTEEYS